MQENTSSKRLLRVEEAADFLNIKPSTVRAWLLARKLPRVHVGERAVRIPLEALERLVTENTVPAREGDR
jgi:excisionase family DNA binding protein